MKIFFFTTLGIVYSALLFGQSNYTRLDNILVLEKNGDTLDFPWAGGINSAQISNIDLNHDGIEDLFVFDRDGNVVKGFTVTGSGINVKYDFLATTPEDFPKLLRFATITDFNCDGRKDILTKELFGAVVAYKNDSSIFNNFSVASPIVKTGDQFGPFNLGVPGSDISSFADIDGDGLIDVLHFPADGTGVIEYHTNNSVNKYGSCDSLEFLYDKSCWGLFSEGSQSCIITLNSSHPLCGIKSGTAEIIETKSRHAGSTILALDLDEDTDKDILLSDIGCRHVAALYNGGIPSFAMMDTIDSLFPGYDVPIDLEYPATYYVDINNDNIKDLLASPNSEVLASDTAENYHSIWAYINLNRNDSALFSFLQDDFLQSEMIDVGEGASPSFFDANDDGLLDLVIGNHCYYDYADTIRNYGALTLYLNIGTSSTPKFQMTTRDYLNLDTLELFSFKPTFGDLDGDGDEDLLIGYNEGHILHLRNDFNGGSNVSFTLMTKQFQNIKVESHATPQLVDFNEDNLLDLLIGEKKGRVHYYENIGNSSSPSFSSNPTIPFFGSIQVIPDTFLGHSVPFLYKDSIGFNLAVGYQEGKVLFYENISLNTNPALPLDSFNFWSYRTTVSGADLDGDGVMELCVGEYGGGLNLIKISNNVGINDPNNQSELEIYPNPAKDEIWIRGSGFWEIYSITGQLVKTGIVNSSNHRINIKNINPGLYVIRANNKTTKFIKK
jgi:hypothetical protein